MRNTNIQTLTTRGAYRYSKIAVQKGNNLDRNSKVIPETVKNKATNADKGSKLSSSQINQLGIYSNSLGLTNLRGLQDVIKDVGKGSKLSSEQIKVIKSASKNGLLRPFLKEVGLGGFKMQDSLTNTNHRVITTMNAYKRSI